ncbi:MAG: hypothetical protein FWH38_04680 [Treponema sp.]|nr:hypothetical protein [Treponema sp.]
METVLLSNGSYNVKALVNGRKLDDCALINSGDDICPHFTEPVADDPDLTGLRVYFLNPQGETVGEKIHYASKKQAKTGAPGKNGGVVFAVESLDQELPGFSMPEELAIGPYTIIFEALGGKETLARIPADIFYLGGADFKLKDISVFLPAAEAPSRLIPPGTTVLLEAGLEYDSRFEPYVVWYNGKNIIFEGKMGEGAGRIFWKTPEHTGFYSLRFEAFPFQLNYKVSGISREITLPVSQKAANTGFFFGDSPEFTPLSPLSEGTDFYKQVQFASFISLEEDERPEVLYLPPELLRWYQFNGNLHDTTSPAPDRSLMPAGKNPSHWAAQGRSYGLSTDADDSFVLSPVMFFQKNQNHGGGIFLFHIDPPEKGEIFSVFFPCQSSPVEGVRMCLICNDDKSLVLHLDEEETEEQIPVYPESPQTGLFLPAAVEFYIQPGILEAKLSLGEGPSMQSAAGSIALPAALAGEGRIRLGGSTAKDSHGAIWNEFAVLSSEVSFLKDQALIAELPEPAETPDFETVQSAAKQAIIKVPVRTEYRSIVPAESPETD